MGRSPGTGWLCIEGWTSAQGSHARVWSRVTVVDRIDWFPRSGSWFVPYG